MVEIGDLWWWVGAGTRRPHGAVVNDPDHTVEERSHGARRDALVPRRPARGRETERQLQHSFRRSSPGASADAQEGGSESSWAEVRVACPCAPHDVVRPVMGVPERIVRPHVAQRPEPEARVNGDIPAVAERQVRNVKKVRLVGIGRPHRPARGVSAYSDV